ncbi:NAD-dependent epimerase/dehydratase family protein [Candidatus Nitrosopelagicus sp.]|jgi:UDP-glucose 4-epimerase|nr:NAD-dependent epimerase/dehydratase family protein [Candidatus Nitrosopelagicus sp.]
MRFVVTGGAGFVGSYLVKLLVEQGHEITVIDNLHKGKKENLDEVIDRIEFLNIDIRDYDLIEKNMRDIDGIFHQAALTVVQDSFKDPEEYKSVNVDGTENIFKIANKNNLKVVYASSSSVYGHQDKVPILENFPKKPINPYGQTKLDDEILAEKYSKLGTKIIGLRYFNIFGKGQTIEYAGVITKFLDRIRDGKTPIIYGDGSQIRDFIYVKDIANANYLAMISDISNLHVNVGTGNAISILDLAKTMIDISGLNLEPIISEALDGDIQKSHSDSSLAKNSFGWISKTRLEDWLRDVI